MKNENNLLLRFLLRAFSTNEKYELEDLNDDEYDVMMQCGIVAPDEIVEPAKNN